MSPGRRVVIGAASADWPPEAKALLEDAWFMLHRSVEKRPADCAGLVLDGVTVESCPSALREQLPPMPAGYTVTLCCWVTRRWLRWYCADKGRPSLRALDAPSPAGEVCLVLLLPEWTLSCSIPLASATHDTDTRERARA